MKKYFLVLGGSIHLKSTILKINKKYNILLLDNYDNPPLRKYSKSFIKCDLRNKEQCFEKIKNYNIFAIISDHNDFAINTYGYLCSKLKLPGIDFKITNQFTNKYLCRKKLSKIKSIKKNIPNFSSIKDFKYNYLKTKELILKPIKMQGSRYVVKLLNNKDSKKKILSIIKNKKEKFIVEEFIDGQIFAIETYVLKNKVNFLTLSKKKKFTYSFIDKEVNFLKYTNSSKFQSLKKLNEKIIKSLGLKNGITHGEYIFSKKLNRFYLVEIACRGGGSGITDIILPYLTSFSPSDFSIYLALNKPINFGKLNYHKRYCSLQWLEPNYYSIKMKKPDYVLFKSDNTRLNLKKNLVQNSEDRGPYFIISDSNRYTLYRKKNLFIKRYFRKHNKSKIN